MVPTTLILKYQEKKEKEEKEEKISDTNLY